MSSGNKTQSRLCGYKWHDVICNVAAFRNKHEDERLYIFTHKAVSRLTAKRTKRVHEMLFADSDSSFKYFVTEVRR